MNRFHQWLHGRWAVPAISGALILASFVVARILGVTPAADVLMASAAVVAGAPIVLKAARALTVKVVGNDLLVSVATIGAVIIGQYWEAAAVTFLFAVGHALENATLNRTRSALAELIAVAPDVAIALRDGHQVEIPAASVMLGDTVLVKNGAKVPVDGAVISGTGALDEASITGESIPVEKVPGDRVFAGTISRGGFLQVEATGVGSDTTLARIIHRVEEAHDAKAATQAFMDRFSAWYTPAIIVLALVVGLVTRDLVLALTLLVIGCPGALVISIPVAVVAGIGRGARDGILIKGGEFLESSARITAVALDKTGTLTQGRPVLTDVVVLDPTLTRGDVLMWAARAEAGSEHPLARPIVQAARAEGLSVAGVPDATEPVPGKGIVAVVNGRRIVVGNLALLTAEGRPTPRLRPRRSSGSRLPAAPRWSSPSTGAWPGWSRSPTRSGPTPLRWWRTCTQRVCAGSSCSPATSCRSPARSAHRWASTRSAPACCPRTSSRWCASCRLRVTPWRWSATASMTPRPSRPPTSVWRWVLPAPGWRSRPLTSPSWVTTCSSSLRRSPWPGAPSAPCARTSPSPWSRSACCWLGCSSVV